MRACKFAVAIIVGILISASYAFSDVPEIVLDANDIAVVVGDCEIAADATASTGKVLSMKAMNKAGPLAEPAAYAEVEFLADAAITYYIYVRGTGPNGGADSLWFQFDDEIGTEERTGNDPKWGIGNWLDANPANEHAWSSGNPVDPVITILFAEGGRHKLRIQGRQATLEAPCVLDQIWFSTTQKEIPINPAPVEAPTSDSIMVDGWVVDASHMVKVAGDTRVLGDDEASIGMVLEIALPANKPGPLKDPISYAESLFYARAGTYFLYVRGTGPNGGADAVWLQFDEDIGTEERRGNDQKWGMGNWLDANPANEYAWSSANPTGDFATNPVQITFDRDGMHRVRIQGRQGPVKLDQIWLSQEQKEVPFFIAPVVTVSQAIEPQKGLISTWGGIKAAR